MHVPGAGQRGGNTGSPSEQTALRWASMQVGIDMNGVATLAELRRRVAAELQKRQDGNWRPKSIVFDASVEAMVNGATRDELGDDLLSAVVVQGARRAVAEFLGLRVVWETHGQVRLRDD